MSQVEATPLPTRIESLWHAALLASKALSRRECAETPVRVAQRPTKKKSAPSRPASRASSRAPSDRGSRSATGRRGSGASASLRPATAREHGDLAASVHRATAARPEIAAHEGGDVE